MNVYLLQLVNGIGLGVLYFVLAVGLSIIFGLLRFVNFAHGAFFLLGAYACFQLVGMGVDFWLTLLLAPLAVGILAWLAETVLFRKVYHLPHELHILITVGLALVLQEAVIMYWGPLGNNVAPPDALQGVVVWGDFIYPKYRLFVIAVGAAMAVVLGGVLAGTRLGAVVRAGSESAEMVALLGLNIRRIFSLVFALGAGTAALAGVLAAPIRGVDPFMGVEALGIAFVTVVVGGMGSFAGALVGGLLVGIVQSLMSTIWPPGSSLMIYVAMALVLLWRPNGLMGRA
ncbi:MULTISPECIES: branched-chain amino acid ABC transporter permease [unclassified Achromobacter]|uniref:branched-chain amino acid ABC transporter permease n=1 Tax=unclassified Achromobacter TaxID=2626865 RepID=UPI000B51828F|nr:MULTISPECIES: branched-chain amino acid ABC transporter permease [unclassified Achromobacter]OWT80858.1 branched-chain amino acid ABC transporter permease [Achromobacter sp. HZ34]OWT81374.1 branched-chain amino acid ABC transporter permease [Achromobacter sp. HZ28]